MLSLDKTDGVKVPVTITIGGVMVTGTLTSDYLPMQNSEKIRPRRSSDDTAPVISPSAR